MKDEEELKSNSEGGELKFDEYGIYGLMNVLHLMAFYKVDSQITEKMMRKPAMVKRLLGERDRHGRIPLHYDLLKAGANAKLLLDAGTDADLASINKTVDGFAPPLVMAVKSILERTVADEIDEDKTE